MKTAVKIVFLAYFFLFLTIPFIKCKTFHFITFQVSYTSFILIYLICSVRGKKRKRKCRIVHSIVSLQKNHQRNPLGLLTLIVFYYYLYSIIYLLDKVDRFLHIYQMIQPSFFQCPSLMKLNQINGIFSPLKKKVN